MKNILCLLLLIGIAFSVTTSLTECQCTQLLSKSDCTKRTSLGCSWDEAKNTCGNGTVTPPVVSTYATYCQGILQADCVKTNGCLWNTDKCTHFTGCTAFNKITDEDCKAISNKCITDGTHCVEKAECKSYLKQTPCVVDQNNKDCFWDSTANSCIDATLCEHYPKTLTTDAACREKNVKCTVAKSGTGCQNSATTCSTQDGEAQCVYGDQLGKQKCFWTGSACVNRTCDQAPANYNTHDQCNKQYDSSCTTNGSGCRTITTCGEAKISEGCKFNSSGEQCYWLGNECKNYNCDAAPLSKNTNDLCNSFKPGCVTKKDGGCKENGECSSLDEIACVKNKRLEPCVFNVTCKDKKCINAPASNVNHNLCSTFMETCTVNATNNGCRDRECTNAPNDINSVSDCNKYKTNCIPKKGGSCQVNTTCEKIEVLEACTKDGSNNSCTWDATLEKCLDKTCANAPAEKRSSHELCQSYMTSCTVNAQKNACIEMICENIVESTNCKVDKSSNKCKYKGSCYLQECRLASQTTTTHAACQQFMTSCTLDNTSQGCMPIPPTCSAIKTQEGCVVTSSNTECAWASNKCQDKSCGTAPATTIDNNLCNTYKLGCLVNNTANGCIDPSTFACASRLTENNCYSAVGLKCVYGSTPKKCFARSCESASDTSITLPSFGGFLTTFSNSDCNTYLQGCIRNNTANGCRTKAANCSDYNQENCSQQTASGKSCYLNPDNTCVELICEKIKLNTHDLCNLAVGMNNSCTVAKGATPSTCMTKLDSCGQYEQNQCQSTKSGKNCIWASGVCRESTCSDAPDSNLYITHAKCNSFVNTCTVIERVANKGCIPRKNNCSDYTSEPQCQLNASGAECYWNGNNTCITYSTLTCAQIVLSSYTTANCEAEKYSCKKNTASTACENKVCIDYTTLADGTTAVSTDAHCKGLDTSCTIDNAQSPATKKCMIRPTMCTGTTLAACSYSDQGDCAMQGSNCILKSTLCSLKTGTNLTYAQCQTYNLNCSVNLAGTACVEKKATCAEYSDLTECRKSTAGLCKINSTCMDVDSTINCSLIVKTDSVILTYQICQDFSTTCSVLQNGTACLTIGTCASYASTAANCVKGTDASCFMYDADGAGSVSSPTCTAIAAGTDCGKVTDSTNSLNEEKCLYYHADCNALSDGSECFQKNANCNGYSQTQCSKTLSGAKCYWYTPSGGTASCIQITTASTDCSKLLKAQLSNTDTSDNICKSYNSSCVKNTDATSCVEVKALCSDYIASTSCVNTSSGTKCYWYTPSGGTASCIQISTASTDCSKLLKAQLSNTDTSDSICKSYNSSCVKNTDATSCVEVKALCTGYTTSTSCVNTSGGIKCYWYTPSGGGTASCIQITASTDCSKVTGSLNYEGCQAYNTACSVNSANNACEAKSCTNKPSPYTHSACSAYLPTCTANKVQLADACKIAPNKCADVTLQSDCIGSFTDGECEWIAGSEGGTCVKKTCYTKISSIALTHSDCQNYLDTCTVAKVGGCTPKAACNTYLSAEQCTNGGNCFWNSKKAMTCVDLSCDKIEDAYNSHTLCNGITGLKCTVKSSGIGCQNRQASCSSYNEKNCFFNSSDWECVMAAQEDGQNKCMEKACTTAGNSFIDHTTCYDYYKLNAGSKASEQCTVAVVTAADGTVTAQGCQKVAACRDYKEQQCHVDLEGKTCVWDATAGCRIKTCQTAPNNDSYDTDEKCRSYLDDNSCTVASGDTGCVERPEKCEGMTEKQCIKDKAGNFCQYLNGACYTKSCLTAPADIDTKDECIAYFQGCTMDETNKCKLEICEDFVFTTDTECEKQKPGCTTNGTKCVLRTSCQAVTNKEGCVIDNVGQKCQWQTTSGTCVTRSCSTAPISTDYDTDAECKEYYTGCTTKNGGGCVAKQSCSAATAESACDAGDINGNKCTWDNGKCRDQGCQDFAFTTHADCKKASNKINCTAGQSGKCASISTCEAAQVRAACIEGIYNGSLQPCLWISGANSGNGACFQHFSCKSRDWKSHEECQLVSNQCTTNGSTCLAISLCTETNTLGGCKLGYDGPCIQTVPALDSAEPAICKAYTSCSDAFYKTHTDCNNASSKCTTNGATSCAPLAACSSYTIREACVKNNVGEVIEPSTNYVTSTGKCTWENNNCRDQNCKDLTGSTHQQCYNFLKGCTSDGTSCIAISTCSTYATESACKTAQGSDGPAGKCYWDPAANNNAGACRIYQCSDIKEGISTTNCQASLITCVSNGTICIDLANCNSASYQNKISCNSGGKDGICVFTKSTATGATENQGTCALMTSCDSAKSDSKACIDAKSRCAWTPASTGTTTVPSKCSSHSCATYKQSNGNCQNFLSWDQKTQQVCVIDGTECKEKDPATLSQDQCYLTSGYTYTWNIAKSTCVVCTNVSQNNNTTTTDPNTTNPNNTDDSGYILGFTTVILGYLVF